MGNLMSSHISPVEKGLSHKKREFGELYVYVSTCFEIHPQKPNVGIIYLPFHH
jgi:hypothetical protein